ncbi:uncharacterized protein CEXT_301051 [Caerostris extrusa]|uniref:Uncharacterized protein n=1 Tax=Caerostris extrusa TaxID=172846 RepID=A0AAV4MRT9_CAEEX|nr:uncharacterized protein CEXT_301051 [Caerostris extrusa]
MEKKQLRDNFVSSKKQKAFDTLKSISTLLLFQFRSHTDSCSQFSYEIPFNCYMMYSLHKQPDKDPERVPVSTQIHLKLNLRCPSTTPPTCRGVPSSVSTPPITSVPRERGVSFSIWGQCTGSTYGWQKNASFRLPYKSHCTDYLKAWKENGGTGPVTEKTNILFVSAIPNFAKDNRAECAQSCSSPCRMGRYEVQVQEANSEGSRPIGMLSFIGGFLGLWLGISLLTVYDFLESRLFSLASAVKRKWLMRKGKSSSFRSS